MPVTRLLRMIFAPAWHATGHRATRVVRQWFSLDGTESDTLYRLAEQDLNTTVAEDVRLVESVQRGLESGGYLPGPLVVNPAGGVNSEQYIETLNGWLGELLGEPHATGTG